VRRFGTPAISTVILALILLLAAALRLAGVHWGLPDAAHPDYSWHPDEPLPILWAHWMAQGHFIAKQFIYGGTLHYSILNAYYHYGTLLAPILGGISPLANTILVGRYVVVAASLLTIFLVYLTGRQLFGVAAGLLAAAFLALSPVHIFLAQNVRPDEIGTLFVVALLYLSALILRGDAARDRRHFIAAGLVLGGAMALRLPLAVFGIGPMLACLLRERCAGPAAWPWALLCRRLLLLGLAAIAAYAVCSPYSLLHPDWLIQGLQVQKQYQTSVFADAIGRGPGIYQYGWLTLRQALGLSLYALALAGVLLACCRPQPGRLLILVPALCYFILLAFINWIVVRYTMPLAPLLALLAASLVVAAVQGRPGWCYPLYAAVIAALAWTLAADLAFLRVQAGRNVRDLASDWIVAHTPAGAAIVDVQQYQGDVYLNPVIPAGYVHNVYLLSGGMDPQILTQGDGHDYLILNQGLYDNMERLRPGELSPAIDALRQVVHGGAYRLEAQIARPVEFFGIDFSDEFTSQDYQIINPGQRIYRFVAAPAPAPE